MTSRHILLLGTPRVEQDGRWVQIGRRKAVGLLAYLAVTREVFTREALAALFWLDSEPSRGLAYLRTTLWTLNQALGDEWAIIEQDTIRYQPHAGLTDDVHEFRALAAERDTDRLQRAIALVRGDFLAGFNLTDSPGFEEWQFFQREQLRTEYTTVLERAITLHTSRGGRDGLETATQYARRWLAVDPLNESAHRWLMRLFIDSGQRAAALRQYQELARLLQAELQTEPEPATSELYRDVLAWKLTTAPTSMQSMQALAQTGGAASPALLIPAPSTKTERAPGVAVSSTPRLYLPAQTTPFVGRARELDELQRLLADEDCHLLTICASGGMGKTRLAIQAATLSAAAQPEVCRDGVYFVALAAARSVEFLHSSILETLVNQAQLQAENWEQLLHHLRNKKLLLVLDNFEHLMGAADALSQLMTAAPGIKLLVTSRERLNLLEEWVFELDGLEYPVMTTLDTTVGAGYGEMEHRLDDAPLEAYSAVRLFIQSARRLRAGLELLEGDLLAIVRICRLVDGMPLGIELAAAWAQMLSVQEIAREVQRSIDFLSTSVRNVPERHRSIRAVFEHSWQSLTLLEQGCLSQLSIFHGAFQLEGAQAVAGASLYMLLALVNKSLLRRNQDGGFEIHELLRQFAESKLNEAAHLELADRHAVYFSGYAANLLDAIISPREKAALDALQAEMDDIRGAWKHAAERRRWELIGQMYLPLIHFAMSRYRIPDLRELVQIALQVLGESPSTPQERLMTGKLLALEAWYTVGTHGIETALRSADRAHTLLEPFQDRLEVAPVLVWIGHLRDRPEHFHASSEQLMQRGIALAEAHGDAWMTAYGKLMLGWRFQNKRRYGEAQVLFHQALQQMRAIGQPTGIYQALQGLDENYRTLGDMDTAYAILDELVEIAEQLGNSILIAYSKGQRDLARNATFATDLWKHTLHAARTSGDTATVAWNLYHGGWLEMTDHLFEASEAHLTEALGLFRALGDVEGESWANLFLGQLALARAEYSGESGNQQRDPQVIAIGVQQARDYAQAAMVRVAQIDFPWPLADAHYLLGSAALAEGNRALALVEYRAALQLARDLQSLIQIIRHLSGFVGLMICEEEYELALLLAAFILQHPISPLDARRSAERHMAHLRQSLSADQVRQAEEQARTLTLEAAGLLALDWQP